MSTQSNRHYFSVADYYRMAETGILSADDRVELIEGEIVKMSPIGSAHAACVNRLNRLFSSYISQAAVISVQNPVRLNDFSEPEPDVALLRRRADFYRDGHPTPADVLLLIEVSDTTLDYDRKVKLPLYARSGIPEVWIVNLQLDEVEIHAQPTGAQYQSTTRARRGAALTSTAFPDLALTADDLFG